MVLLSASTPFLGHPNFPEHDTGMFLPLWWLVLLPGMFLLRYELDYHTKLIFAPTAPTNNASADHTPTMELIQTL